MVRSSRAYCPVDVLIHFLRSPLVALSKPHGHDRINGVRPGDHVCGIQNRRDRAVCVIERERDFDRAIWTVENGDQGVSTIPIRPIDDRLQAGREVDGDDVPGRRNKRNVPRRRISGQRSIANVVRGRCERGGIVGRLAVD
jgi:hypothetical protein